MEPGFSVDNPLGDASMLLSWLGKGLFSAGLVVGELVLLSKLTLEISPSVISCHAVGGTRSDCVLTGSFVGVVGFVGFTSPLGGVGLGSNRVVVLPLGIVVVLHFGVQGLRCFVIVEL